MGAWLAERSIEPEVLVTSPALRAHTTLARVADEAGWSMPQIRDDRLYGADPREVLRVVEDHRGAARSILVCGHEPWCSGVVALITGERVRFPTATVACVDVHSLDPTDGRLVWIQRPKEID